MRRQKLRLECRRALNGVRTASMCSSPSCESHLTKEERLNRRTGKPTALGHEHAWREQGAGAKRRGFGCGTPVKTPWRQPTDWKWSCEG